MRTNDWRFSFHVPLAVALSLGSLSAGCGGSSSSSTGGDYVTSDKARLDGSTVPAADVTEQAEDNETFAFNLYAQLKSSSGNLFFSPYSVSSALSMTWAGAVGDTATGIQTALDFSLPSPRAFAAFDAIDQQLATRASAGTAADPTQPFTLNVANALWAQKGLTIKSPFLDTLAVDYGTGVRLEDFITAPDSARGDINGWVSKETDGKIPTLLGPGTITDKTRFVLTNAVYFSGSWAQHFETSLTKSGTFTDDDGTSVTVPLMTLLNPLETVYASGTGWQAVEIPYSNLDLTMTVIVPDAGQLPAVEAQLDASFFDGLVTAENAADVILTLPKFSAGTQASLAQPLTTLGMGSAFGPSADFSGIDGARDLLLTDVVHQATISIDENGTTAAAATAVLGGTAVEVQQVTLTIDRPFFIVIRDRPTHSILFVGRISHL